MANQVDRHFSVKCHPPTPFNFLIDFFGQNHENERFQPLFGRTQEDPPGQTIAFEFKPQMELLVDQKMVPFLTQKICFLHRATQKTDF